MDCWRSGRGWGQVGELIRFSKKKLCYTLSYEAVDMLMPNVAYYVTGVNSRYDKTRNASFGGGKKLTRFCDLDFSFKVIGVERRQNTLNTLLFNLGNYFFLLGKYLGLETIITKSHMKL